MKFHKNHDPTEQSIDLTESAARTADAAVHIGKSLLEKLNVAPSPVSDEAESAETIDARQRWNASNPYDRLLDRNDSSVAEGQVVPGVTDNAEIQQQLDAEAAATERPGTL